MEYHLTDKCKEAIDALLNENNADGASVELLEHAAQCPTCQNALNIIGQMRACESAFEKEPDSQLKLRIMKKLESELNNALSKAKSSKSAEDSDVSPNPGEFFFARIWQTFAFAAALAAIALYAMSAGTSHAPAHRLPTPGAIESALALSNTYKINVDGSSELEISIDNPVTLLDNETASIEFPDGSKGKLSGPARITIMERGFHLIQGDLFIEVRKMPEEFTASTPHAQITVLGTSFRCISDKQKTVVSVKTGKVSVTADNGVEKILSAGESAEVVKEQKESQSASLSPVDSE